MEIITYIDCSIRNKNEQILWLYQNNFKDTNWNIKDINTIIKKRKIFYLLLDKNNIVGLVNGFIINTKEDDYVNNYIIAKETLIVSDLISTIKKGGTTLLNNLSKYQLDIFLTSIDIPTMEFYKKVGFTLVKPINKKDKRLVMINYINKAEALLNREKTIILLKGDPKYEIDKKTTKTFYNKISEIVNIVYGKDPVFYESGIKHGILCKETSEGDVVIGFSRGGNYASIWKKYCNNASYFIGIGCPDKSDHNLYITNPKDKTFDGDISKESLMAHWEITNEMFYDLETNLKQYYKLTNR